MEDGAILDLAQHPNGTNWPLLVFMEVTDGERSGALTGVTRLHSMHPDPYKVPTPAHLAPALLPSRTKMPLLVGGRVHI